MNVLPSSLKFIVISDAVIRISTLPNSQLSVHSVGEASLDKTHNTLKRKSLWS